MRSQAGIASHNRLPAAIHIQPHRALQNTRRRHRGLSQPEGSVGVGVLLLHVPTMKERGKLNHPNLAVQDTTPWVSGSP